MKINGISNIQKIFKSYGAANAEKTKGACSKESLSIEISQKGKEYRFAMEAFKKLPEIRSEKVEALKAQIQAGTYRTDSEGAAAAMVDSAMGDVKL